MAKLKSGVRSKTGHRTLEQSRGASKKYQSTSKQRKNRAMRNAARRKVVAAKGKAAVKGKDVGHKRSLMKGGTNAKSNLKIQSRKSNRGHGTSPGGNGKRKK
jgi:hypothetical protein